jgi:uncharacterized membrane protein
MLKNFIITLIVFLGIDFVWLGIVARNFYKKELGAFSTTLSLPAAFLAYVLIAAGIVLFVLPKASGDIVKALLWGAVFGLIAYGIYDFTNLATLKGWSIKMLVVDTLWGVFVCGITSLLATLILNKFGS